MPVGRIEYVHLGPMTFEEYLSEIDESLLKHIVEFDFSDDDNYDKEFELDYDGRVQLANFDFTNSQELIEMIVEEVHKLFVEVEDND